jgi:hypothetical protein
LNRSDDQEAFVLLEFRIRAGAIDFGCGWAYNPLMIFHTLFDDTEVHLKVQVVDANGVFNIEFGGRNGHKRKYDVTFLYVIFNPFFVDRYITLKEVEKRIVHGFTETVIGKVHTVDDPVCLREYPLGQMMADKSVYPKN